MRRCLHCVLFAAVLAATPAPAGLASSDPQVSIHRPDEDVRKDVEERLAQEPQLKGLAISVKVDARQIVMGGRIHTLAQRDLALKIAKTLSDGREVIDDFQIIPEAGLSEDLR